MPELNDFIEALLESENDDYYEDHNNDRDLGKVFEICKKEAVPHEMRFSDGTTGFFTFE